MKPLTVQELREALAYLPGDVTICVWLPGSRIDLRPGLIGKASDGAVMIEGNLRPGSVLS